MESGGSRTYEIRKDKDATEEQHAEEKAEEEKLDPMKALENRVLESQKEMATLDQLEEIRALNARHIKLDAAAVLRKSGSDNEGDVNDNGLTAEDEALVQSIQFGSPKFKRLGEEDERRLEEQRQKQTKLFEDRQKSTLNVKPAVAPNGILLAAKRKRRETKHPIPSKKEKTESLSTLLGGYASSSEEDGSD